jgi:hypothetical protein
MRRLPTELTLDDVLYESQQEPRYVPQTILKKYISHNIAVHDQEINLVMKFSWLPKMSIDVEGRLFKDCDGMFGVANYYFSYMVAHKPNVMITNHLLLPKRIKAIGDQNIIPDHRALWGHALDLAGESLLSVKTPRMLIMSIVHAIIGNH